MTRTLTALALALAVATPAFAADDAKSVAQQLNNQWLEAYNKGDASALAALYTGGAVLLPQGHPTPITGRADIEKFFDGWMKQKLANASIPVAEAKMLDQKTLYAAGTWSGEAPGEKGASSTHLRGTYLMVAVQDGSSWRLQADTWNMMPPSGAQPATATAPTTQGSGATAPAK
jgi:uncharacterized protein (TIGR02246 family)